MEFVDRRRYPRPTLDKPELAFIQLVATTEHSFPFSRNHSFSESFYANVLDFSGTGALIESPHSLEGISRLSVLILGSSETDWKAYCARPVWMAGDGGDGLHRVGLEFLHTLEIPGLKQNATVDSSLPSPFDSQSLRRTHLLDSIPDHAVCHLLNCFRLKILKRGERLFAQGEVGDWFYIIESGDCSVKLEKDHETCHLTRLQEGEVVGEMAVLTGEPRSAHVDAESDMRLWGLSASEFRRISRSCPDLRYVLTELVTHRLEAETLTGERRVGKYIIRNKLGKGGWSIVYQGAHHVLNIPVAIKMLKHNMAMEEGFLEKFRNEAKIIAQLNHRNIVRVYDIEELFQTVFIMMEHLEGHSLDSLLQRMGRIPVPLAVEFLVQICQGLAYAHERGIIHQDIKPANIFVQPDHSIKILDFGLACPPGTEDMNLAGTVYYAAPEQILGNPVDARTDIYALGITAYELAVGRRPYPEEDLNELVSLHLTEEIPDPAEVLPQLPKSLCRFILKACRRKSSERYQTAHEAAGELQALWQELCPSCENKTEERSKAMGVLILYQDHQQLALSRLLDEFSARLLDLGVTLKAATFDKI